MIRLDNKFRVLYNGEEDFELRVSDMDIEEREQPHQKHNFWEGKLVTYEQWFESHDWYQEDKRRAEFQEYWNNLDRYEPDEIASRLDAVIASIKDDVGL